MDAVERFDHDKATVQASKGVALAPKAFPKDQWDMLPVDAQPEALSRASWLVFMGGSKVRDALIDAAEGMDADMRAVEPMAPWSILLMLAERWPRFPRSSDGRYLPEILDAASRIEQAARDVVFHPGLVDGLEIRPPVGVPMAVLDAAFEVRVGELRLLPAPGED